MKRAQKNLLRLAILFEGPPGRAHRIIPTGPRLGVRICLPFGRPQGRGPSSWQKSPGFWPGLDNQFAGNYFLESAIAACAAARRATGTRYGLHET